MTTNHGAAPQVITMWELYGCGMTEIAKRVADQLGVPVHGQAFSSEQVESAMEQREREGAFGRFLSKLSPAALPNSSAADTAISKARSTEETARGVRAKVAEMASEGGVILGWNGQFLLHQVPGALHVKLVGEKANRVARAAQLSGISAERSARRQPLEDDFRRATAVETFKFDPTQDEYYDLVLDVSRFTVDQIVELIVSAARARAAS